MSESFPCLSSGRGGDWACGGCMERSGIWCGGSSSRAGDGGRRTARSSAEACGRNLQDTQGMLTDCRVDAAAHV